MTSSSTYTTDLWSDYRAIGAKLKKRLLRKPNYGEAAKEYAHLANRLHNDEISPHYAALCHQNAARCHSFIGNTLLECAELKKAARLFGEIERDRLHLNLPEHGDTLASAVHCYGHAIRCHVAQSHYALAAALCTELAAHLMYAVDAHDEAAEWCAKAVRYADADPLAKCCAQQLLCVCLLHTTPSSDVLLPVLDDMHATVVRVDTDASTHVPLYWRRDLLAQIEITTLLTLIHAHVVPKLMSERHAKVYTLYAHVDDTLTVQQPRGDVHDEETFALLQSFTLACAQCAADEADAAASRLVPRLNALQNTLTVDIVLKMYAHKWR